MAKGVNPAGGIISGLFQERKDNTRSADGAGHLPGSTMPFPIALAA